MKTPQLLTAREFQQMVAKSKTDDMVMGRHSSMTVQHDVHINSKEIDLTKKGTGAEKKEYQSIHLENIVFNGMVMIGGYDALVMTMHNTHFLGGLWIESCSGSWITMSGCQVKSANFWCGGSRGGSFEVVSLDEVKSTGSIDLSGLNLTKRLSLNKVEAERGIELIHSSTGDTIHAPAATTDNLIWALQLRMAGIPVIISTADAKKMLVADPSLLGKVA